MGLSFGHTLYYYVIHSRPKKGSLRADLLDARATEKDHASVGPIGEPAKSLATAIELRGAFRTSLVAIEDDLLPAVELRTRALGGLAHALRAAPCGLGELEAVTDHVLDELKSLLEHVPHQVRNRDAQPPRLILDGVLKDSGILVCSTLALGSSASGFCLALFTSYE